MRLNFKEKVLAESINVRFEYRCRLCSQQVLLRLTFIQSRFGRVAFPGLGFFIHLLILVVVHEECTIQFGPEGVLDFLVTPFSLQFLMPMRRDHSFDVIDKFLSLESFWVAQTEIWRLERVLRGWLRYLFIDEPRPSSFFLLILVNRKIIGAWPRDIIEGKKSVILIIYVVQ